MVKKKHLKIKNLKIKTTPPPPPPPKKKKKKKTF